jgi:hypothetical protein
MIKPNKHKKINPNIQIDLINHHVSFKKKETERKINTKQRQIIHIYNYLCRNHIFLCDKIERIKFYKERFDIIEKFDFLTISQVNKQMISFFDEKDVTDKSDKYVLLHFNNNKYMSFSDFLFHLPDFSLFLLHTLNSYSYLLESLTILQNNYICFFNISSQNIVFSQYHVPILQNFKNSLLITNYDEYYIKQIINSKSDFTFCPLEIHLLFFLIQNTDSKTITETEIKDVINHYISSLLDCFSPEEKIEHHNKCINALKKYIDKPYSFIMEDTCKNVSTWDNYGVSVLYLHIFYNISEFVNTPSSSSFLTDLIHLLKQNIDPDPLKRETIIKTSTRLQELYEKYPDWGFVKSFSKVNMMELYEKILK